MSRTPVVSSSLSSVGYDSAERTLEIEFRGGRVYRYFAVPAADYDGLLRSSSKGQYFNENIRDKYDFSRVR